MYEPPPEALVHVRPEGDKNVILKKKGKLSEAAMHRKFFSYLTLIDDFDKETMGKVKKKIDTGWDIHLKEDE